jgi:dTDP-4-dehydrorhamnose reductase
LLIGASGQLGRALAARFADRGVIAGAHQHVGPGDVRVDLGDASATRAVLFDVRPDLILVAGAMCNVDLCETEPELCTRINTEGPAVVADYARTQGACVVFFSTDHVFDGTRSTYVETEPVHPLNGYARSKAEAEDALRSLLPDRHLILRTAWVYGPDPQRRNFALRLVDRLQDGAQVPVASDQWGSPTYTEDLASATRDLVDRSVSGTFHATGPEFLSRAVLAVRICAEFSLDAGSLQLRATADLGQLARRPLRVHLDCTKLHGVCDVSFRDLAEGLRSLHTA